MAKIINRNTLLVATQDQVSADLSSDTLKSIVILGLKDGVYYELKEVAARVWNLVQNPCSIQIILDTLLSEYDVEPERCEADLFALAEDLAKHGLVDIRPPEPAS
jgi:hypothetical protein